MMSQDLYQEFYCRHGFVTYCLTSHPKTYWLEIISILLSLLILWGFTRFSCEVPLLHEVWAEFASGAYFTCWLLTLALLGIYLGWLTTYSFTCELSVKLGLSTGWQLDFSKYTK